MRDTVLVTGGNGFLGRYVCARLANAGRTVVAYDVMGPAGEAQFLQKGVSDRVYYVNGQVTDLSRMIGICQHYRVSSIVHTAGFVEVESAADQPSFTYQVNTFGSIVAFDAARLLNLRRVVLISSNGVYQHRRQEPIGEHHSVFSPSNGSLAGHYGASKLAAEVIGLTYVDQNGLDLIILRASSIYGFGMQRPLYVKPFVESATLGRPCHLPSGGDMPRDYTYVTDVAEAVEAALEADKAALKQRVFNISAGKTHTAAEVVGLIRELISDADISIGSALSDAEMIDSCARGNLDISSAQRALGYRPRYDLRAGLSAYIENLRAYRRQQDNKGNRMPQSREKYDEHQDVPNSRR